MSTINPTIKAGVATSKFYDAALKEMRKRSPDVKRAGSLLRQALRRNDPRAAYALGTWYLHGTNVRKNLREAFRLLQIAAQANISDALFDLAVMYETGEGARLSFKLAATNYLRAALNGDNQAVYEVGRCYFYGIGFRKDVAAAKVWFCHAKKLHVYESEK